MIKAQSLEDRYLRAILYLREQFGLIIIITFSRPVDNHLVNTRKVALGLINGYAIQILFIFDEGNYVTNY